LLELQQHLLFLCFLLFLLWGDSRSLSAGQSAIEFMYRNKWSCFSEQKPKQPMTCQVSAVRPPPIPSTYSRLIKLNFAVNAQDRAYRISWWHKTPWPKKKKDYLRMS